MDRKRIVITGMGAWSPLGNTMEKAFSALRSLRNRVELQDGVLGAYRNFNTRLGAVVHEDLPSYPRKKIRTMGRIGVLAAAASEDALRDAGLLDDPVLTSGDTGIAYGSSGGSSAAFGDVAGFESNRDVVYLKGSTYVTMMPHTVPVNLSIFFGITGQIVPTSVACASGSMAIGYGRDMMLLGRERVMLCGGAEEFSPFSVGVFDALFQTSRAEDPSLAPRPFDRSRDGIVVGEGAGTVILEEYESARARGAKIYAEVDRLRERARHRDRARRHCGVAGNRSGVRQ